MESDYPLRESLVVDAFRQAARTRNPDNETIFHNDRGSQYGSVVFRAAPKSCKVLQSMSTLGLNPERTLVSRR